MPYLLRVVRRGRWLPVSEPWYSDSDLQGDCLNDLKTDQNILSFWFVDEQRSNLEGVICAIAAGREHFAPVDYALLSQPEVEKMGRLEVTPGASPFSEANDLWHRDLQQLTLSRLCGLAHTVKAGNSIQRVPEKRSEQLVREYTRLGKLRCDLMKPKMAELVASR